ncbi:MAG: IS1 family transposase [Candidatus Dormibacteraceae bacterium]
MNRLSAERRARVLSALVEGNSIRATCRMTGVAKGTVMTLLADAGAACMEHQDANLRNLPCRRIECDEIWSFVYAKAKNVPESHRGEFGYGDIWTWTAIDADTKLVPAWMVGTRDAQTANIFMADLASRLAHRVQLTSDGHKPYLEAVERAFGGEIDFATLVKLYGNDPEAEKRYSLAKCLGTERHTISGKPERKLISTSYVERQNLTMRMGMRRFTRLTNAFSKKVENLEYAVALHFMHYNFCRPHKTLSDPYPTTPAMAAGVADHVWSIGAIVALVEAVSPSRWRSVPRESGGQHRTEAAARHSGPACRPQCQVASSPNPDVPEGRAPSEGGYALHLDELSQPPRGRHGRS